MTDALSNLLRWLDLSGGAIALGAWLLAVRAPRSSTSVAPMSSVAWRVGSLPFVALTIALVAAGLGLAVRAAAVANVPPLALDLRTFTDFTFDTQAGRVRALHTLLLLTAWVAAISVSREGPPRGKRRRMAAMAAIALAQAAMALAGHAVASDQPARDVAVQATHALAASIWLGGLCLIAWASLRRSQRQAVPALLRAFSPAALIAMALIVSTGALGAVAQVDRWPPLFGTPYGHALLAKLALLVLALGCAAVLRQRWLPRLGQAEVHEAPALRRWLLAEAIAGVAMLACASRLASVTPAAHDAIRWPLAFRFAWDVALSQPGAAAAAWTGTGIAAAGAVLAAALASATRWRRSSALAGALAVVAGGWVALPKLAVDAHPDAYRASSVAYEPVSIANGRRLYLVHCVGCHGADADGRGPQASGVAKPPADLTAAHAREHTPGDLFDWLSRGMRGGLMPGFGDRLSEDDRWDLVNYLHTLAAGYQARVIQPRVAARNPWLAAPAFAYETADGERGSLRDLRERRAVLLVLDGGPPSSPRLRRLRELQSSLHTAGVSVLRMPMSAEADAAPPGERDGLATLRHDADVVQAYMHFRRTLERMRPGESGAWPTHAEFLIDRFGYLRARWIPDDTRPGWDDSELLLSQARALADEPRLKPPPDDHLH